MYLIILLAVVFLFEVIIDLCTNYAQYRKAKFALRRSNGSEFASPSNLGTIARIEKNSHNQNSKGNEYRIGQTLAVFADNLREHDRKTITHKTRIVVGTIAGWFLFIASVAHYVLTLTTR